MPDVLAAIRPDDFNLPLFLHVAGAMLVVGVVFSALLSFALARRSDADGAARLTQMALRTILYFSLPAYLLMRVGAQLTEAKYDFDTEPGWIDVGYITGELTLLLTLASTIVSAIGLKKLRAGGGAKHARAVMIMSALILVAYLVAVWAMTTKQPD